MVSSSAIEFIDASLSYTNTSKYSLSYQDSSQKWIIRDHLLSLLRDFPSLEPSCDQFTHNDGTTVNLLNISGHIPIPPRSSSTTVPLIIWVHENYPFIAPMIFVVPNPNRILTDHPHVDSSSGSISSPYLLMWNGNNSNLSKLVQNIVNIFSFTHEANHRNSSHPSLVSRQEAIDRLTCSLHYDVDVLRNEAEKELEALWALQGKMSDRAEVATSMIIALEEEKQSLENRVVELMNGADSLIDWLEDNDQMITRFNDDDDHDDAFRGVDDEEDRVLGCLAEDMAVDDVIYELDKALNKGVIPFRLYIKQVRELSREQFFNRALLVKLRGPQILYHYSP
ncbi:protein ELC-like [Impatiens glandulifera]|uniref:protein ELC-like n=1 Tax=Impatiens glandulifera TaxID=253017 RepID=UPI001FB15BCB|nr:protein ELC-like [Impatiens glandulifera]